MEKLRIIRKEMGFTQKELANFLNVSQQTYSDYENGKTEPDIDTIIKMAEILQISVDYLVGRTDELGAVTPVPAVPQFSEEDREILSLFHALTPEYRAVALKTLRSWAGVPATGVSKKKA